MVVERLQRRQSENDRSHLPAELERALRNCRAALESLGAAEARVCRQLAAVQAERAALARKPFAPMTARPQAAGNA
jgi:hypothetical protein